MSLLLFSGGRAAAQDNKPWAGFGVETSFIGGRVIKHTAKFRAPVPELSTAIDINLIQHTYGRKPWHQRRNFPVLGFGVAYIDYGIDSIYGKAIGAYPNLQFYLVRGKRLEWTFRAGYGAAYITKFYRRGPHWDTFNTAVSSHFNNLSVFATDLRYHINEHWDVQAGGHFTHVSNAALRQPNLGVNMYGAHLGFRYYPVTSRPQKIVRKLAPLRNRWLIQGRFGMSFNEAGYTDGPSYPVYIGSAYISKRWLSKNKLFAGIDYSYHENIYAFLRNNEAVPPGEERKNASKSAVFIGNEFMVGRVGILLQVGYYIKEAALKFDPYYEKLGGNFYILQQEKGLIKELYIAALLKTHKTQAELAEFGLGFGL